MGLADGVPIDPEERIETARCRLRYPDASDLPHIWSAARTPGFNDGLRWAPPSSRDEIADALRRAQAAWATGEEYGWAIERRESGAFLGWISIRRTPQDRVWSIGFWVHPTRQGEGYATECAARVLRFGFSRLGAEAITAAHATWNTASGRVLQRIGMTLTGTNPKGFEKNGAWVEEYEYEMRRE